MTVLKFITTIILIIFLIPTGWSSDTLKLQPVTDRVYAIVGELGNRSNKNFANNATFGFVVTSQGVVLIDSGGSYQGAKNIHKIIKTVTDKPVTHVINSGGQDHRWLGNDYFKQQGAKIIASQNAMVDQKNRVQEQFIRLGQLIGDQLINETQPVYADTTFDKQFVFKSGGTSFEIYHSGQAHTPGDSYVWLPEKKVMFTGDIVYVERMLGVGTQSNSKSWLKVFEAMAAFKPKYIVPGHGSVTHLTQAEKDTYHYLRTLRQAVTDFTDEGGDISEVHQIDQAKYHYLLNFKSLSVRNAQQVYTESEWE